MPWANSYFYHIPVSSVDTSGMEYHLLGSDSENRPGCQSWVIPSYLVFFPPPRYRLWANHYTVQNPSGPKIIDWWLKDPCPYSPDTFVIQMCSRNDLFLPPLCFWTNTKLHLPLLLEESWAPSVKVYLLQDSLSKGFWEWVMLCSSNMWENKYKAEIAS